MIKAIIIFSLLALSIYGSNKLNTRPIIGIFTQPSTVPEYSPSKYSFISASYVKYLESSGAQVVPVFYDATQEYIDTLFTKINGLIFPGGSLQYYNNGTVESTFLRNAAYLIQKAKNATDNGESFPIWGTCLGFQLVCYIESGFDESILLQNMNDTSAHTLYDIDLSSKQYSSMPFDILQYIQTYPAVYYHHEHGISVESFVKNQQLKDSLKYTSQSTTTQKVPFVGSFESHKYPFFGSQFHPEKNMFEWKVNAPHDYQSIQVAQFYANFFVNLTRQNLHSFNDVDDENKYLIYQYPVYALKSSDYTQIYILPNFMNNENTETSVSKENNLVDEQLLESLQLKNFLRIQQKS